MFNQGLQIAGGGERLSEENRMGKGGKAGRQRSALSGWSTRWTVGGEGSR